MIVTPDFLALVLSVVGEEVGVVVGRHWERAVARSWCELVAAVQRVFLLSLCPRVDVIVVV